MGIYKEICAFCNTEFDSKFRNNRRVGFRYCSKLCCYKGLDKKITCTCSWCNKEILKIVSEIKKSKNNRFFCNRSCSASYNNTLKRKSNRSKMEIALYEKIKNEFTLLKVVPNDKVMLDGYEVDIGMPEINLAIEWNGIVHYKPIYGQDKLDKIQQRDNEKLKIAEQKGISLIVIPDLVSNDKYLNEAFVNIKKIVSNLIKH